MKQKLNIILGLVINICLGLFLRLILGFGYPVIAALSASKEAIMVMGSKEKHFTVKGVIVQAIYSLFTAIGLGIVPLLYKALKRLKK